MPFTGGWSPSPERTGGGDAGGGATLLQRVFESIAGARGDSYDQGLESIVGAENMAYARAICLEMYGGNIRLANQFNPATMTADGLLPRWERILNCPPNYGDPERIRRARVAAAFARCVQPNSVQPVTDACSVAMGPLFQGLKLFDTTNCLRWWPARGGSADTNDHALYGACSITSVSGALATVDGLSDVPTAAPGALLTLSNCDNGVNDGTFLVHDYVSPTSVKIANPFGPIATDYGSGGSSGSPTITWAMNSPLTPWLSTISHIDVSLAWLTGYYTPGSKNAPNAAFYQLVGWMMALLDEMLPAWTSADWYLPSQHGGAIGWYCDEPNVDIEILDS